MDITKMEITELKALAYDALARIEANQADLRAINAQIERKSLPPKEGEETGEAAQDKGEEPSI